MSGRKVAFALAGTAAGALLLIGARASQDSSTTPSTPAGKRLADLAGATSAGPPGAGTYTQVGPVVTTPFGPVQVRVGIVNGRIGDVTALQTPAAHGLSLQLSTYATPILRKETLTAQNATIDVVSGATYTSDAYAQSLQEALNDAATR